MKKVTCFVIFVIPIIFLAQNNSIKYWSKTDTLKFDDFKGVYLDKNFLATSVLSIRTEKVGIIKDMLNVQAVFNISKSTFFNVKSKNVLKHEQIHFDIAELFARKIRKELLNYYKETDNIDMEFTYNIYDKYVEEFRRFQKKYDYETSLSLDIDKQKEWNNKVEKELEKYKEYTNDKYLDYIDEL